MSNWSVPELNLLAELEDSIGLHFFAAGFELFSGYENGADELKGWFKDPEFAAHSIIPFAMAGGNGSIYAFWRVDDREDLAALPVVVLGGEGGEHVVARNLRELFQLLAYDAEPMVGEEVYYYRTPDEPHSEGHAEYVAWLSRQFGLSPTEDPDAVVEAAQAEFGQKFNDWFCGPGKGL